MSKIVLGRGLEALLPAAAPAAKARPVVDGADGGAVTEIAIERLVPNPQQPRAQFDPGKLEELGRSIREKGILQPIIVKRAGDKYQIVAGERRWRAAQQVALDSVPVIVKDGLSSLDELEWALIENLQREDLNPIDEALGYRKLADTFHLAAKQIAARVGKDRTTVSNAMRLLSLPQPVRDQVGNSKISPGHARALLALDNTDAQIRLAKRIVAEDLSVRRIEELVYGKRRRARRAAPRLPEIEHIEARLRRHLGTMVRVIDRPKRGRIVIDYYGHADLNRILDLLRLSV